MSFLALNNIHLKNIILDIDILEDSTGRFNGLKLKFSPLNSSKIYNKSDGTPVNYLPKNLELLLNHHATIQLLTQMVETHSTYLYSLRRKVTNKDIKVRINSNIDNKFYMIARVTKHFFRDKATGKGRIKMSLIIFDKETNEEIVSINLTKRDVKIIMNIAFQLISSQMRTHSAFVEADLISIETNDKVGTKTVNITKIDSSIVIDNIWLHGQEILNLLYITQELLYGFEIENRLRTLNTNYRQVFFFEKNGIMYLELSKLNSEDAPDYNFYKGEPIKLRIPISAEVLAIFASIVSIDILRHSDIEDELIANAEILNTKKIYLGRGVKYHMSTKESIIGIAVNKKTKDPNKSKILLVGKVKDNVFFTTNDFGEITPNYMIKHENGEEKKVPVLMDFQIDLKDQWIKLVKGLSYAYTKEYLEKDRQVDNLKFFVINQTPMGRYKYQFIIFSDPENKAQAVLVIEKYRLRKKEETLEGRFRQPLFRKYLFQLLTITVSSLKFVDNFDYTEEIPAKKLLAYKYSSINKVKELNKNKIYIYGIRKNFDQVLLGNFTKNEYVRLNYKDITLLNLSSKFRLFNKEWIPFIGDSVTISPDDYLTDRYSEINLEEGEKGPIWAVSLYAGTSA